MKKIIVAATMVGALFTTSMSNAQTAKKDVKLTQKTAPSQTKATTQPEMTKEKTTKETKVTTKSTKGTKSTKKSMVVKSTKETTKK